MLKIEESKKKKRLVDQHLQGDFFHWYPPIKVKVWKT